MGIENQGVTKSLKARFCTSGFSRLHTRFYAPFAMSVAPCRCKSIKRTIGGAAISKKLSIFANKGKSGCCTLYISVLPNSSLFFETEKTF